jgi:poly(3-hydroxybutyrate) depolymerase
MIPNTSPTIEALPTFKVKKGASSISGLSSGAFMTVQLHLAHSASFCGVGVIAGGPYRCVESFPPRLGPAQTAYVQNAMSICMNPLTPHTGPDVALLLDLARKAAQTGEIDDVGHIRTHRVYIFTGKADAVVHSEVVRRTRKFYEGLCARADAIRFRDDLDAGHAILTDQPEHSPEAANQPPYINNAGFMQSHEILRHIYPDLDAASPRLTGRLIRFDQTEFFGGASRASMSQFGYAYVPQAVQDGAEARIHIALHGCKQGYNYTDFVYGGADTANQPPFGDRYMTSTGYNSIADANNIIVLYPQAEGRDDGRTQNPEGCWDWWGYSAEDPAKPDYHSREAIQIKAIHGMLSRLGG